MDYPTYKTELPSIYTESMCLRRFKVTQADGHESFVTAWDWDTLDTGDDPTNCVEFIGPPTAIKKTLWNFLDPSFRWSKSIALFSNVVRVEQVSRVDAIPFT